MGQELELDFEKYCVVDASPKTVLPSPRHSNLENRKVRKKPKFRNEVSLNQTNEFTEITFNRYRSASCKTNPSIRLQVDEAPRRGSVYQSSMNRIKEKEKTEGRQKIAVSRKSGTPFSSEIVDSLCNSDEDNNSNTFNSVNSVNKENLATSLHKSLSSRLSIPQSPTKTETDSPKSIRFSPFRKMFDPFTKSKSFKTPLNSTIQEHEPTSSSSSSTSSINTRKITSRKSLLNDFSNTEKDSCTSIPSSSSSSSSLSPAHLCGTLKVKNKNGMPYFEFSVKNPNDLLVAKTWNMGDGFNWVYTFHMAQNRRTSNVSGRSSKDSKDSSRSKKEFLMMAQMQVSCYICTKLINSKSFDNSMLTEFVLYDLTRPKEKSESTEIDQEKVNEKVKVSSNPWSVKDLNPDLETAAIVLQFPNGKRESLKGDMRNDENLEIGNDKLTPTRVDVVVPKGNHGLPGGEGCGTGPAPLLDRWRMGGGCECGGWDMGCPLVVFGSRDMKTDQNGHVEIFLKGGKEKIPSLTMKRGTEVGQYVVDFHAQLSSLQAFSICVAILHGTEASVVNGGDMNRKILECDSLRVFIEDEVKHLIEGQKGKLSKNLDEISNTFVVNPPFSPMSRA